MKTAMTSERIKEIQATTGYPDSVSIKQALLQVWNECEQSHTSPMSAEQVEDISKTIFASIDHYREAGRDDEFNIKSIAEYLQRHFATTPSVKADGWVRVEDRLPEIIEGKDYSENVFAWCNGQIMIMCRTWVDGEPESGYVWANCYDDIDGEGIWDENYYPTHWQPLQLPSPPITE